MAEMTKFGSNK